VAARSGFVTGPVRGQNSSRTGQPSVVRNPYTWLIAVPLVLMAISAFLPVLENGFVNFDDDKNFVDNPYYRGLGLDQLKWACTTFWLGVYQPLAWLFFELQYVTWKGDPRGFHLCSLIMHAVNTVVLYMLVITFLGRCQPVSMQTSSWTRPLSAGLATALFALHPLRVEVVAWASGQKYLPCALFLMLAVLAYVHAFKDNASPAWRWLVATFLLFVAALFTLAVAVTLPIVLLILDVYPLKRFGHGRRRWFVPPSRRIWYEKVPFFAMSFAFAALALAARGDGDVSEGRSAPLASVCQACYAIWFYIGKTILPLDLIVVYSPLHDVNWLAPRFLFSVIATLVVSGGLFMLRRRWPGALAAWLCYLVILAPNLGIVAFSEHIISDRYAYITMISLYVATAGLFASVRLTSLSVRALAIGMFVMGSGLMAGLIAMTLDQCQTWRNSETLWTHALAHGGVDSPEAHYNMAIVLYLQSRLDAAADETAEAIRLNPRDFTIHNFMGVVLQRQGKIDEAVARFTDSLRINPDYVDAHYDLAILLSRQGKFDEAAKHYREALRLKPDFADAQHNMAADLSFQGKLPEAMAHYTEALRLNPGRADTHSNLGVVLSRLGNFDEAAMHYAEALRHDPANETARRNLDIDRARRKKPQQALPR
jgi:protein O-mannosyl-transferase